MGCSSLTSKVGMTTLVSVSLTLVSPSMLRIVLRRHLPLYLGLLSADMAAVSLLLLHCIARHG